MARIVRTKIWNLALSAFITLPLAAVVLAAGAVPRQSGSQVEVLDRVVATIGGAPVTQFDLIHEYKVEGFIAGRPANSPDASAMENLLSRFIDQKLLEKELGSYHFNAKSVDVTAKKEVAAIMSKFKSGSQFQAALRLIGMNQNQLMSRVEDQEEVLRMIDLRLRPSATVNAKDIAAYYHETFLPEVARRKRRAAPPLSAVEGRIRKILVQKKINQLLDEWLLELRKENQVQILAN